MVSQICIMRDRKRIRKEKVSGKTDDLGKNGSCMKTFFRVDCFTTMKKRYFARTYNVHNENDADWCVALIRSIGKIPNCQTWWRHQMETFSALLALCAGNSAVTGEFPPQRLVTRSFDVSFNLRLNKPLSKQSWGWWFETPSRSLCRHCNETR